MKPILQKTLAVGIVSASLIGILSVNAHTNCDIKGNHIHLYKDPETSLVRLINSEKDQIGEYYKTDSARPKTSLEKFIAKHNLINIDDCSNAITNIMLNYHSNNIEMLDEEGTLRTYEITYRFKFIKISNDPATQKYYLEEQYVTDLSERYPGFNYIDISQFAYETKRPITYEPTLKD